MARRLIVIGYTFTTLPLEYNIYNSSMLKGISSSLFYVRIMEIRIIMGGIRKLMVRKVKTII